jgi:UDP-N-acetylmuramoylalanine-D-glutamate ligase
MNYPIIQVSNDGQNWYNVMDSYFSSKLAAMNYAHKRIVNNTIQVQKSEPEVKEETGPKFGRIIKL